MRMVVFSPGVGPYLDGCEGRPCEAVADQDPALYLLPPHADHGQCCSQHRAGEQSYLQNYQSAVIP